MKNKIFLGLAIILILIFFLNVSLNKTKKENITNKLELHFLDVGQADSILAMLPNGQTMLIDAASGSDGGKIAAYLRKQGIERLNYVVATHPHKDHIGGLDTIVSGFNIDKIYMPSKTKNSKSFEDALKVINKKGIRISEAKAGVGILKTKNLNIEIIAPNSFLYDEINNYSAVIKITYKNNKFLFMGDAQTTSENEILKLYDVKADVLKVAHHGSDQATSEEFLNKVMPKYSVISVGKGNPDDCPSEKTISRLSNINSKILRTDKMGTIIIKSDGNFIDIENIK